MGFAERGDAVARPFLLRWLLIPLVLAGATLGLSEGSDIDRALTRLVFDPVSAGFPLRTSFLLDVVMHHWAKYAVVTIGSLVAGCYALSFLLPALRRTRRILLYLVLALTLAPLSVTLAKAANNRHCPWDVEEFGGLVPYTGLFGPLAPGIEPGHCFPAGHAATGFALMAFYFAAYALGRRRAARLALSFAIAAGLVLGAGRVLQGAHFASHVIWSGILCWTVMVALYALLLAGGTAVIHPSPAAIAPAE